MFSPLLPSDLRPSSAARDAPRSSSELPPLLCMARLTLAYLALMLTATHAAFRVLRSGGPRAACRPVAAGPRAAALFARSSRMMCTPAEDAPPEGLSKTALKKLKKQQEQAARKAAGVRPPSPHP